MASFAGGYIAWSTCSNHTHAQRTHCKFYKERSCYNTYQYSRPDSAFQVPLFLQGFKTAICMNDSARIRISTASSAFLFNSVTETSPLRFCCIQTCLWWEDLYLRLEIQRHMVNVRAGQQSRVIDSGLVYQLSDRAVLIFFLLFYFKLGTSLEYYNSLNHAHDSWLVPINFGALIY